MTSQQRVGELDGIEWFIRLVLTWAWVPLLLGIIGWFAASTLDASAATSEATVELGLSDAAEWPWAESVLPRAAAAVESGRAQQELGLEGVDVSLDGDERRTAPFAVVVSAPSASAAENAAEALGDYLVEDSREFGSRDDSALLAATQKSVEQNEAAIDELTSLLTPLESRIDVLEEAESEGIATDAQGVELSESRIERDQLAAELRERVEDRADAIVERDSLQNRIDAAVPPLEKQGVASVDMQSTSSRSPVGALVGAIAGLIAIPMLGDRFGSIRSAAGIRRVLGDLPVVDLTSDGDRVTADSIAHRWASSIESAVFVSATAGVSPDVAASVLGAPLSSVVLVDNPEHLPVADLVAADLVLVVATVGATRSSDLRVLARRFDLLDIDARAVVLSPKSAK